MAFEICTTRVKAVLFNESSKTLKGFYNGICQDDSVCSFQGIAQSHFYGKTFCL